jgi:hypothetical protein
MERFKVMTCEGNKGLIAGNISYKEEPTEEGNSDMGYHTFQRCHIDDGTGKYYVTDISRIYKYDEKIYKELEELLITECEINKKYKNDIDKLHSKINVVKNFLIRIENENT